MSKPSKLGAALDRQSWLWLLEADEDIALGVAEQVEAGVSPDAIRRYILAQVGPDRSGLANRAMSAARHLESVSARS